jgi:hypothetical protein
LFREFRKGKASVNLAWGALGWKSATVYN